MLVTRIINGQASIPRFSFASIIPSLAVFLFLIIPLQVYINIGLNPIAIGYLIVLGDFCLFIFLLASRNLRLRVSPLIYPLLLIMISILLSLPRTIYWDEFFVKFTHLGIQVVFYLLILNTLINENWIRKAIIAVIIGGIASGIIGVLIYILINLIGFRGLIDLLAYRFSPLFYGARGSQFFLDGNYFSWTRSVPGQVGTTFRATSLFISPGENAFFSSCLFFIVLTQQKNLFKHRNILWFSILAILLLNIVLTQARAVWLGLLFGFMFYLYKQRIIKRPSRLITIAAGVLLLGTITLLVAGPKNIYPLIESIITRKDGSSQDRMMTIIQGIGMISEYTIILGFGPGNERVAYELSDVDWTFGSTTHSMYIDTGIAIGGLGLLAYIWLMFWSWKESEWIRRNSCSKFLIDLAFGYQLVWLVIMVSNISQGTLFGSPKTNLLIWGLMGLVSTARIVTRRSLSGDQ